MQQNAPAAGALPRKLLGELTAPPDPQLILRQPLRDGKEEGGKFMGRERTEGQGKRGEGSLEVGEREGRDLEQGRRLAWGGPGLVQAASLLMSDLADAQLQVEN